MSAGKINSNYYTKRNVVKLIRGGHEYFVLLTELMSKAIHSIHLQTYIFDDDVTGIAIADEMIKAARRNVQVYFMVDGYASRGIPKSLIRNLMDAGVHFKFFEPLFKSKHFYLGRRLHQKVVVIDGRHGLVGGINISNRYNDLVGMPAWLDFALYVKGEAAVQLFRICSHMWKSPVPDPADLEQFLAEIPESEYCSVRVRRNDWVKNKVEIWRSYMELFNHANTSIVIMCSYFLPGWELLRRLGKAAKRGVRIKIILTGPTDVQIAKLAERYLYDWMLRNSIEIFEYQPNVLHAKLAVTDGHWVTIGSYNINNISAHASMEINLDIRNKPFAQKVQNLLENIIMNDCIPMTKDNYKSTTNIFKKFWQKAAYHLYRLILNLFTFYFKREVQPNHLA